MRRERSQTLKGFLTVLQRKASLPVRVQVSHRIFSQASILRHEGSKPELAKKGEGWIIAIHLDDFVCWKTISSWSLAHCCFARKCTLGHQRDRVHTHTPAADTHSRGSRQLVHGSWAVLVWMVNTLPDISSQEACMTPLLPHPQPLRHHWMFWNRVSSCRNHPHQLLCLNRGGLGKYPIAVS